MTIRDETMRDRLARWVDSGVVASWDGPDTDLDTGRNAGQRRDRRWVGVPTMSALVKHLLEGIPCRSSTRAIQVHDANGQLEVAVEPGDSLRFDRVVVAVPASQTADLLGRRRTLIEAAAAIRYAPCWAAMAEFAHPYDATWVSARVNHEQIALIARNHTKPGRPERESWVVHATPAWSRSHLEQTKQTSANTLMTTALGLSGWDASPVRLVGHRWRYALVETAVGQPCLFEGGIGLCGDGLLGGRIESALLSGAAMAERILRSI